MLDALGIEPATLLVLLWGLGALLPWLLGGPRRKGAAVRARKRG